MTVSVIVVTWRAGPGLRQLLDRLAEELPDEAELIVVRSGTAPDAPLTEDLEAALDTSHARTSVVGVEELGAAPARQAGLEAGGDIALYIDDDCTPEPGWFAALTTAMQDGAAAAGGTIVVDWPDGVAPRWLPRSLRSLYGERVAGPGAGHRPFGANMAIRRDAALRVGGFAAHLGPVGTIPVLHEETELCERLAAAGYRLAEAPEAIVRHRVRPDEVRPARLVRRSWYEGRSDARRDRREAGLRSVKLAGLAAAWPFASPFRRPRTYVTARIAHHLGYLVESVSR